MQAHANGVALADAHRAAHRSGLEWLPIQAGPALADVWHHDERKYRNHAGDHVSLSIIESWPNASSLALPSAPLFRWWWHGHVRVGRTRASAPQRLCGLHCGRSAVWDGAVRGSKHDGSHPLFHADRQAAACYLPPPLSVACLLPVSPGAQGGWEWKAAIAVREVYAAGPEDGQGGVGRGGLLPV